MFRDRGSRGENTPLTSHYDLFEIDSTNTPNKIIRKDNRCQVDTDLNNNDTHFTNRDLEDEPISESDITKDIVNKENLVEPPLTLRDQGKETGRNTKTKPAKLVSEVVK